MPKIEMAESKMKQQGWKFIASVAGLNTVNFSDLIEQGYTEAWVYSLTVGWLTLAGPTVPLGALGENGLTITWGGHYGGVNGGMMGVGLTSNEMTGRYCRGDSADKSSTTTFYLYAR